MLAMNMRLRFLENVSSVEFVFLNVLSHLYHIYICVLTCLFESVVFLFAVHVLSLRIVIPLKIAHCFSCHRT